MKLEIPLSVLRILTPFCSLDETRFNLNGIAVTDGCATATDGHRLLYCESARIVARDVPEGRTALLNPRALVGLKVRPKDQAGVVVRIEGDTPESATASLDSEDAYAREALPQVRVGACVTLVEFPDWRRACIPKIAETVVSVYVNGRYLADFGTAAIRIAEYLGTGSNLIRLRAGTDANSDGLSGVTVDFGNTDADAARFVGILMPIRH